MLDAGYVREKLGKVIEILSTEDDATRNRLVGAAHELNAIVYGIRPWGLDPAHDWIREGILKLVGSLTGVADLTGRVGSLAATVGSLTDDKAKAKRWEIIEFSRRAHDSLV